VPQPAHAFGCSPTVVIPPIDSSVFQNPDGGRFFRGLPEPEAIQVLVRSPPAAGCYCVLFGTGTVCTCRKTFFIFLPVHTSSRAW
jgi:hypothetical protein